MYWVSKCLVRRSTASVLLRKLRETVGQNVREAGDIRRYVDGTSLLSHRDSSNVIMMRGYIYGSVRRSGLTFIKFALSLYK